MSVVSVFFSYSHVDEEMRDQLEKHLIMLKRNGDISTFHDRKILAGATFGDEIDKKLLESEIILLLVSVDFLNSEYCFSIEMKAALERRSRGEAEIIPVIIDHCDWHNSPLKGLLAATRDGKPITEYANYNKAFLEITNKIRNVINSIKSKSAISESAGTETYSNDDIELKVVSNERSANLHVKKEFTDLDKENFLNETYDYMNRFLQNTLNEFEKRNVNFQTKFSANDSEIRIMVYKNGNKEAFCKIIKGGTISYMTDSIIYSEDEYGTSFSESLSVVDDGTSLLWNSQLGINRNSEPMTQYGAAEYFWEKLISRFQ